MVKVELSIINVPAATVFTVYDAYCLEGCLWMNLDEEGDLVRVFPLHTLSYFTFKHVEEVPHET